MAFKRFLLKNAVRLLQAVTPKTPAAATMAQNVSAPSAALQAKAFGDLKDAIRDLSNDPNADYKPQSSSPDVSELVANKKKALGQLSLQEKIELARYMTVSKDPDVLTGFSLWEAASKEGSVEATYSYADCIRAGRGTQRDPAAAFAIMSQLAKENNLGEAHLALGLMHSLGEGCEVDHEKAYQCFRAAGHEGVMAAIYNLGNCFADGKGVQQSDAKALLYYEAAADVGDPAAMFTLANWIVQGRSGMKKDVKRALDLQIKAAATGHPHAAFNVGALYFEGDGLPGGQDVLKAVEWFQIAADRGVYQGAINLGNMYVDGLSPLTPDLSKALSIFHKYSHLHPEVEKCAAMLEFEMKRTGTSK